MVAKMYPHTQRLKLLFLGKDDKINGYIFIDKVRWLTVEAVLRSKDERELLSLMKANRIPHGVILQSSQPVTIQKYAQLLSQWAVCQNDAGHKSCGECSGCLKVLSGNHIDVYTAQTAGKLEVVSVDEIRHICSDAYIMPNEATAKVYILPNAEKMQIAAQNAFLKVLEEPPQNILFILCCTNAEQLLGTIRSRAMVFNLDSTQVFDEKILEAQVRAKQIATAIIETKGIKLLEATGSINDRGFARLVMTELSDIIRQALITRSGGSAKVCNEAKLIQRRIHRKNLIEILETINTAQTRLGQNINIGLFTAWLCATLRRQK